MSEATEVRVGKSKIDDGVLFHPVVPEDSEDIASPQWLLNGLGSYLIQSQRHEFDADGNWVPLTYIQYEVRGQIAKPGDIIWVDEDGKIYVKSA